jgi:hypothetical protein
LTYKYGKPTLAYLTTQDKIIHDSTDNDDKDEMLSKENIVIDQLEWLGLCTKDWFHGNHDE